MDVVIKLRALCKKLILKSKHVITTTKSLCEIMKHPGLKIGQEPCGFFTEVVCTQSFHFLMTSDPICVQSWLVCLPPSLCNSPGMEFPFALALMSHLFMPAERPCRKWIARLNSTMKSAAGRKRERRGRGKRRVMTAVILASPASHIIMTTGRLPPSGTVRNCSLILLVALIFFC